MQTSPETSRPVQEAISDEKMGQLISAIGNHENKALLCVAMASDTVYTSNGLVKLFNSIQGSEPGWQFNSDSRTLLQYCSESLAPIGLVAKEVISGDQAVEGYIRTPLGAELGQALSGHLLELSLEHPDISLMQLFGRTGTTSERGVRAPMTRVEIIAELLTLDLPARVTDIFESDHAATSSTHLRSLAKEGLVNLETRGTGDDVVEYAVGDTPFDELDQGRISKVTDDVRSVLEDQFVYEKRSVMTISEVVSALLAKHPEYQEKDQHALRESIRSTLQRYAKRGGIKRVDGFTSDGHSIVDLTEDQRSMLEDCLTIVYGMQEKNPDFIKHGIEKARAILSRPELVSQLTAKAREKSPYANTKSRSQTAVVLGDMIQTSPGMTVGEIEKSLGSLSKHSIRDVLRKMEVEGVARREKRDNKIGWFILDTVLQGDETDQLTADDRGK